MRRVPQRPRLVRLAVVQPPNGAQGVALVPDSRFGSATAT